MFFTFEYLTRASFDVGKMPFALPFAKQPERTSHSMREKPDYNLFQDIPSNHQASRTCRQ